MVCMLYACAILSHSLLNPHQEMGGYFIVNGNERLIRMLIMLRRNYVSLHSPHLTHWPLLLTSFSSLFLYAPLSATGHCSSLMEEQRSSLHWVWDTDTLCSQGPDWFSTYLYSQCHVLSVLVWCLCTSTWGWWWYSETGGLRIPCEDRLCSEAYSVAGLFLLYVHMYSMCPKKVPQLLYLPCMHMITTLVAILRYML